MFGRMNDYETPIIIDIARQEVEAKAKAEGREATAEEYQDTLKAWLNAAATENRAAGWLAAGFVQVDPCCWEWRSPQGFVRTVDGWHSPGWEGPSPRRQRRNQQWKRGFWAWALNQDP
jgi:hypothetical protein